MFGLASTSETLQKNTTDTPTKSMTKPATDATMVSDVDVSTNCSKPNAGCCAAYFKSASQVCFFGSQEA
eukprot:3217326-Karenia_brevis.AAC.1